MCLRTHAERTVAEYLLAEVLERQSEEVRRLLLRTSLLERVSGELADLLTGGSGGDRILQDLEEAGAFVVSLDGRRSWFRYHRLFADLLQLQLRHAEPGELPALHATAAGWYAGNGYPAEAVRHAQAAQDWSGPRRAEAGTYDAWTRVLRTVDPRFEFTDPPLRHSLPMDLAFAATADRPTAVLTGPSVIAGSHPGLIRLPRPMVTHDMVRVGLEDHPLTATAALVWSGDLPRPLQQILFDAADGIASSDPAWASSTDAKVK